MRFSAVLAVLSLSAFAAAAPATVERRQCENNVVEGLDEFLTKVVPEIKPLLTGVDGTEDALGEAVPALQTILDTLEALCL